MDPSWAPGLGPRPAKRGAQGPALFKAFWTHLVPFGTIWSHIAHVVPFGPGPCGTILPILSHRVPIWSHSVPIWSPYGPYRVPYGPYMVP